MQDAVHRYDGTVIQFTGDGILALFGAPIAHEDSARRAVAAALEMQKSLCEYAAIVAERYPIECSYRVGLNTGPVVVGKISDNFDLDFTAVGDTVNLAARMESMAESGTVYLTENTYRVIADYFDCESLGELKVKGKSLPVVAYRAVRARPSRRRLDIAAEHGLTPFVGRERELNILSQYLEQATQEQGQIVFVSGEAGMGKSRLLLEFRKHAEETGVKWLEGHCVSYGRMTPYLPFIDIAKDYFGVQESDNDKTIIGRVEEGVAGWSERSRNAVSYLRFLLNVDPGDETTATMDPMERRAGIFEGLRALLREASADRPLVVVVEDLHWIDEKSEDALNTLVDSLLEAPVLLILTSRPGYRHRLSEHSFLSRLALSHLQAGDSTSMVEGVLKTGTLPQKLIRMISEKAEGNPFYIEEVTKSLLESGALSKDSGDYRLERPLDQISVPDTIQEVILSRIDRLDRIAKNAMQLASVIGREFAVRLLNRIADVEAQLDEVLDELKHLELIYETGYWPELSYMFKHALTHDVAYSTLLIEKRRSLHRIVAVAIEELYADRLPEHYEALAHHFEEGETWEKALDYLEKAGDKAVQAFANQDAIDYYGRALNVAERLGDETRGCRASIAEKRAWINFTISYYAAAVECAKVMLDISLETGDSVAESHALTLKGFFETYEHSFEEAEASLSRAAELSEEHGDPNIQFMSRVSLFSMHKLIDRHEEAEQQQVLVDKLFHQASDPFALSFWTLFSSLDENWKGDYAAASKRVASWRALESDAPQVMVLGVRWSEALIFAGMGKYTQAIRCLNDIVTDCARIGEFAVRARALNTLGWIYGDLQDHGRAMEFDHRGIEVALEEGDDAEKISNARLNWGDSLISEGRLEEAHDILSKVEPVIRSPRPQDRWMHWRFSQHYFLAQGELCLTEGDYARAISLADECLQLAEPSDSKKYIVKARRLRGQALRGQGETKPGMEDLETAARIATQIGNPAQAWKSYAALAAALHEDNRASEAHQAQTQAREITNQVAQELRNESLQNTFIKAQEIQAIRDGD